MDKARKKVCNVWVTDKDGNLINGATVLCEDGDGEYLAGVKVKISKRAPENGFKIRFILSIPD